MINEVWKSFEENKLTHSAAHYLMTIHALISDHGYARVTDIAKSLDITRGSCSISLRPLKRRGLVVEDENKFLQLSEEGERLAKLVERNDELLVTLFHEVLGVDAEQAKVDACKIEHLLSIETSVRLSNFIQFIKSNRKSVRAFQEEFRKHEPSCPEDKEECDFCRSLCFFDEVAAKK